MKRPIHVASRHSVCLLRSVRKRTYSNERRLRYNRFPANMLCYVIRGKGTLLINGQLTSLEPDRLVYIPPGASIEASLSSETLDYYAISVLQYAGAPGRGAAKAKLVHTGEPLSLFGQGAIDVAHPKPLRQRIEQLIGTYAAHNANPALVQLQFQELLHAIVQQQAEQPDNASPEQRIELTIQYMQQHYQDKIEMSQLSAMVNLTSSSFSRLFKKTVGESPIDYLTRLRIERAKQLLSESAGRIKEVSSAVGYEDEFYFSRIFHRTVGVSPTVYMKSRRLKVAVASCLHIGDSLQTLGVEPVAAVSFCRIPGMDDEEHRLVCSAHWEELSRAQPDLIISDRYHQAYTERLGEIAHVVPMSWAVDWLSHYRKIAEVLGRGEEADRTLNQLALSTASARRTLHRLMDGSTSALIQVGDGGVTVHGTDGHPLNELLFQELGLKPGKHAPLRGRSPELQPEWLPPLEADCVFLCKKHVRAGSERVYERMIRTDAWQSIQAVRRDRVLAVPHWFRLSWTPPGRARIIDELLVMLEPARDGQRDGA